MIPKIHRTLKGYRPLSVTSCLVELCEKLVNEHLVNQCEKLNRIRDQKSAYRSSRSTTDNLLTLTEKAMTSNKRNDATAGAFLDVEQAFDSLRHESILYKQVYIETTKSITEWTSSNQSKIQPSNL